MVSMSTWQFFVCGAVFTLIGMYWGYQSKLEKIVEKVIDNLIEQGFIRTRKVNGEIELLKHWENDDECNG